MATKTLREVAQKKAYSMVRLQLICVLVLAILSYLVSGKTVGFSVLMGGFASTIPNLIFVWRVFRFAGAQQMTMFMAAFFFGEMFKLFLSGILFLIIVKYLPVSLLSVLVGFAGAIVAFWVASFWYFGR